MRAPHMCALHALLGQVTNGLLVFGLVTAGLLIPSGNFRILALIISALSLTSRCLVEIGLQVPDLLLLGLLEVNLLPIGFVAVGL
jgi:hypothetical protein